jgi:hypothetical protein
MFDGREIESFQSEGLPVESQGHRTGTGPRKEEWVLLINSSFTEYFQVEMFGSVVVNDFCFGSRETGRESPFYYYLDFVVCESIH